MKVVSISEKNETVICGGREFKEKESNSDCGEFDREPTGGESQHGHDFCISGRHLSRLARIETESHLY